MEKPCTACETPTIALSRWKKASADQRATWTAEGRRSRQGRGLCSRCYRRSRENGTLIDFERHNRPLEEVVEEWAHLADPLIPIGREVARLAPQLGMKEKTLGRAVWEAGFRSRFHGGWGERVKAS